MMNVIRFYVSCFVIRVRYDFDDNEVCRLKDDDWKTTMCVDLVLVLQLL